MLHPCFMRNYPEALIYDVAFSRQNQRLLLVFLSQLKIRWSKSEMSINVLQNIKNKLL